MSSQVTRELQAVHGLKRGITHFAEQVQSAIDGARKEAANADKKAQEAVERRRSELNKRVADQKAAQDALSQCQENCGGLQRAVADAGRRVGEAQGHLDQARKASHLTSQVQKDLAKVSADALASVKEHASVASSALADLDAKLREIGGPGSAGLLSTVAVGLELVAAVSTFAPVVGNAMQSAGLQNSMADPSLSSMVERQQGEAEDAAGDEILKDRQRHTGETRPVDGA